MILVVLLDLGGDFGGLAGFTTLVLVVLLDLGLILVVLLDLGW